VPPLYDVNAVLFIIFAHTPNCKDFVEESFVALFVRTKYRTNSAVQKARAKRVASNRLGKPLTYPLVGKFPKPSKKKTAKRLFFLSRFASAGVRAERLKD